MSRLHTNIPLTNICDDLPYSVAIVVLYSLVKSEKTSAQCPSTVPSGSPKLHLARQNFTSDSSEVVR